MNRMKKVGLGVLFLLSLATPAAAAPQEPGDSNIGNGIFEADYTRLPDDSEAYYQIDAVDTTQEKENNSAAENFVDGVTNFNPIENAKEDVMASAITTVINVVLEWNMMMVNLMIGLLNFAFATDMINGWIDGMDGMISGMAGVIGVNVTGGLFGALLQIALILSAFAALYQWLAHRAMLQSMQTLLKTLIALTAAFIIIANFTPIMKGLNEASSALAASLMTGYTNTITNDNRTAEEIRSQVDSNLWENFIGRPYMILQYGTDDVEGIGEARVQDLLALPPGEDRVKYVTEQEIGERGNDHMTYKSGASRLAFTVVYSVINMIVSIPIFILALALLVFQLWFLMVAFLAPFALIQAVFPGQFGVLKRYAVELIFPLVCKLLATAATLFVFSFGFVIYNMPNDGSGLAQYFSIAAMQFGLFAVFILGRKRIMKILGAGDKGAFAHVTYEMKGLKDSMHDAAGKIGTVASSIATVATAAATGGTSTAVTAAAASVVASKAKNTEDQHVNEPNENSTPVASYSEPQAQQSFDNQPESNEKANDSQPVASYEEAPQETAQDAPDRTETAQPMESYQEAETQPEAQPAPQEPVRTEPETTDAPADNSAPLASFHDTEEEPHKLQVNDETGDERYKGEGVDDEAQQN